MNNNNIKYIPMALFRPLTQLYDLQCGFEKTKSFFFILEIEVFFIYKLLIYDILVIKF